MRDLTEEPSELVVLLACAICTHEDGPCAECFKTARRVRDRGPLILKVMLNYAEDDCEHDTGGSGCCARGLCGPERQRAFAPRRDALPATRECGRLLAKQLGISYRQLSDWLDRGLVSARLQHVGSGETRTLYEAEYERLRYLVRISKEYQAVFGPQGRRAHLSDGRPPATDAPIGPDK